MESYISNGVDMFVNDFVILNEFVNNKALFCVLQWLFSRLNLCWCEIGGTWLVWSGAVNDDFLYVLHRHLNKQCNEV